MLKNSKLEAEIAALKAENASLKAQLHLSTSGGLGNATVNASDYNNPRTSQAGDSEEAQSLLLKIREESTNSKASIGSIIVNATYRPLSTLPAEIQGIESGMNANQVAKRAKMRLIKLECFLTWPSLIVYEHVNPSDVLEIPYSDVGDDIWATTTVLSWRWDESKPWTHAEFIAKEDFTPMSRDQFTELQTMIRAMPSSISYIWVDWSCGEPCLFSSTYRQPQLNHPHTQFLSTSLIQWLRFFDPRFITPGPASCLFFPRLALCLRNQFSATS